MDKYLEELAIEPTLNGSSLICHIQNIYDKSACIEDFLDCAFTFVEQHKGIIINE